MERSLAILTVLSLLVATAPLPTTATTTTATLSATCSTNPCKHGATCTPIFGTTDYTCVGCNPSLYSGKNCDTPVPTTTPAPTPTGAELGQMCRQGGNILPIPCAAPLLCNITSPPPTNPDIASTGVCVPPVTPAPCICPLYFKQVCGTDGRTYSNQCFAKCAGAGVAYTGPCKACTTGVYNPITCPSPFLCVIEKIGNTTANIPNKGFCGVFNAKTMCKTNGNVYEAGKNLVIPAGDDCNICNCLPPVGTGNARLICTLRPCAYHPTCPPNKPLVICPLEMCVSPCPGYPGATCTPYPCGGCFPIYTLNGAAIRCPMITAAETVATTAP